MSSTDLLHVSNALNAELLAAMASAVVGTQAHVGMLELVEAATAVLVDRGYLRGCNPSSLPVLVDHEDNGPRITPILCF